MHVFDMFYINANKLDNLKTEKEILYNKMRERLMQAHEKGE